MVNVDDRVVVRETGEVGVVKSVAHNGIAVRVIKINPVTDRTDYNTLELSFFPLKKTKVERTSPTLKMVSKRFNLDGKSVELIYSVSIDGKNEVLEVYFYKSDKDLHVYRSYSYTAKDIPEKYLIHFYHLKTFIGRVQYGSRLVLLDAKQPVDSLSNVKVKFPNFSLFKFKSDGENKGLRFVRYESSHYIVTLAKPTDGYLTAVSVSKRNRPDSDYLPRILVENITDTKASVIENTKENKFDVKVLIPYQETLTLGDLLKVNQANELAYKSAEEIEQIIKKVVPLL